MFHATAIFPGYYTGRATHIHTKVFTDWKVLPNGTFEAGRLAHVGQFFFDDDVNVEVDKVRIFVINDDNT
jgi:protocatechuate 3,4-dioxygenase beta subunit